MCRYLMTNEVKASIDLPFACFSENSKAVAALPFASTIVFDNGASCVRKTLMTISPKLVRRLMSAGVLNLPVEPESVRSVTNDGF